MPRCAFQLSNLTVQLAVNESLGLFFLASLRCPEPAGSFPKDISPPPSPPKSKPEQLLDAAGFPHTAGIRTSHHSASAPGRGWRLKLPGVPVEGLFLPYFTREGGQIALTPNHRLGGELVANCIK